MELVIGKILRGSIVTFLILVLGHTFIGTSYASTELEGESTGNSVRVITENRRTVRTGPTVQNIDTNSPSISRPGPIQQPNVRTEGGRRSQSGGSSGEASSSEDAVCLNRSEIFSAMIENRECDPSIPAAVSPNPRPQQPVPVANNQPQVVVEPVEIVITASDLLELIPSSPQILMDRGPFGLKNAHTNFYASNHRPQTVTRTMFDQQVTITATPIEYRWDYGDGNTFTTELPGHPVDVFNTATDTSHQYTETGLYTVNMTTVFEGTYQVDGGETQMVSSTVTQQADPVEIRIWRAVTRNVDQTCLQNPKAWGC